MSDSMFDKMMAHLQLKGATTSERLQEYLQIHPGNLALYIEIARAMGLVREMSDNGNRQLAGIWQLTDKGRKYCNLRAVASKEENRPKEGEGRYVVLSSNSKLGSYNSLQEAKVQACNFARETPGKTFRIARVVVEVSCDGPQVREL